MKRLIIINGTMGVGKSTVSQLVADKLDQSVFLDGDWCWNMHPWVFSDENKEMVIGNIAYLLNSFLANSSFEFIIFCWVLHEESITEQILSRLSGNFSLHAISLVCSKEALTAHFTKDTAGGSRAMVDLEASYARMALYQQQSTKKIDVSTLTAAQAADTIIQLIHD